MKLGNILKFRHKRTNRQSRIDAVEALGMKLVDERGWVEGKFYSKRYIVVTADGRRLDNGGEGFGTSNDALNAAVAEAERLRTA